MKNVITFLFITAIASSSFALVPKAVKNFLPAIHVIGVEVDNGPAMAAVQPTAFLKFRFPTCAMMPMKAEVKEKDGKLLVSVVLPIDTADCAGMPIDHDYSLQISSDYRNEDVIVLNPVPTFFK